MPRAILSSVNSCGHLPRPCLCSPKLFVLREIVCNREPRSLGADEDVRRRANRRIVEERSHSDVDETAITDDGVQERTAGFAVSVMVVLRTEDKQVCGTLGDGQLAAFDSSKRLEGRTCRSPAVGAVAVECVE